MFKYLIYIITIFGSYPSFSLASELDRIIPPEIKNDAFYNIIYNLAKNEPVKTILEIGSSNGEGSTDAFTRGISQNPSHPTLFCMEISKPRFKALKEHYQQVPYVKCYNVSSVPLESFPTESAIISFLNTNQTNLNMYGCERVLGWLRQDIEYIKTSNAPQNGIEMIKQENKIDFFDMVLIDGSEFTGMAEFKLIYGARFILLDDTNTFKNYANYQLLLKDPYYELVAEDQELRNGFAIFKKTQ